MQIFISFCRNMNLWTLLSTNWINFLQNNSLVPPNSYASTRQYTVPAPMWLFQGSHNVTIQTTTRASLFSSLLLNTDTDGRPGTNNGSLVVTSCDFSSDTLHVCWCWDYIARPFDKNHVYLFWEQFYVICFKSSFAILCPETSLGRTINCPVVPNWRLSPKRALLCAAHSTSRHLHKYTVHIEHIVISELLPRTESY